MAIHNHEHDHTVGSGDYAPGYFEIMEIAVGELLVEKQLIGAGEIRRQIEVLDPRTPALGAKVVARAWVDPDFRARLLANGRAACEELGITFYDDTGLIVLENTDKTHNLVVCTFAPAIRDQFWDSARLVQAKALSCAGRQRATRGFGGIRHHDPG